MSVAANTIAINAIQTELAQSKKLSALSASERRELLDALPANIVAIDVNYANVKVGDRVFGTKSGINGGAWFFGVVTTAPPTSDAHITFNFQT